MAQKKRCYEQYCGAARALDFVGERWTLLIVRDLLLGPKRYTDLLDGLPGLTTNLLAKRLADMERSGLVDKVKSPPPAPAKVYKLTQMGLELEPLVLAAMEWGDRFLIEPEGEEMVNIGWSLLRLKSRYRGHHYFVFQFHADGRVFHIKARQETLFVMEGPHSECELTIAGPTAELHRMLFGPEPASNFPNNGQVTVEGKVGRWPWLLAAFGLS